MNQAETSKTANVPNGRERRQHVRHPINTEISIAIQGVGNFSAHARDFCVGGLLIVFSNQETINDPTELNEKICLVNAKIDGDDYRMRARIAHADAESAGLAFVNPDTLAIKAFQSLVTQPEADTTEISDKVPDAEPVANKPFILNKCNVAILSALPVLLKQFNDSINDYLFNQAKEQQDVTLQNDLFQSMETINSNREPFESFLQNSINQNLDNISVLVTDESFQEIQDIDEQSLELVSDEEFNRWLANSKVKQKIERHLHEEIKRLEIRLGKVYGEPVNRDNNPYGPCLFVNAFQQAIESLDIKKQILPICYDIYGKVLLTVMTQLYSDINNFLIKNNILPDIKDIYASSRPRPQQSAPDRDPETTEQANINTEESPRDLPNLYDLVGEIRNLQALVKTNLNASSEMQAAPAAPTAEQTQPAVPEFSTTEVIDVISRLNPAPQTVRGDGSSIEAFKQQLQKLLEQDSADNESKNLSNHQNQVIDVTENIFMSILNDLQVAQSVRPWLEKIAVPVMKMALLDDNIFTDKDHIVRQVINKIADLEVLASAEEEKEQLAVKNAFNWIVNLINNDFDGTARVYERAAQQLELLINVQQQAFESNLQNVVAVAVQEEQQVPTENMPAISINNDDLWHRMVSRLKENSWVLLDALGESPLRSKIAWIAPKSGKHVFVNVMGRKERVYNTDELVEKFRSGDAVVLDGAEDPAMDRAQYTMLQNLHKQLLYQSSHDDLTGLINRREFTECMRQALVESLTNNTRHAVAYIDLDNFQVINNNYGYDAGDELIKQTAELITSELKEENILSRIGGDHFALLIQDTSIDDAVETLENIMDKLQDYRFSWNDDKLSVTLSAGITMITGNVEDVIDLLHSAESSCKIAKEAGGNQVQIFHAGSNRITRRKRETEWATKIDKALEEDALYLRCQKIIPIQQHVDQRPHFEVLLGISDEFGGNVNLETFITAAEQNNRMADVDRWVIQNTFSWLANNEDVVSDISCFTINLSGQSFNNDRLIDFIYQQISRTSVPIERVCFEITETSGVSNLSDAADFIETIKSSGCQFALDDFGSGMSSYSYLKNLPVDYLKIDGIFIREIVESKNDYAVVKSICEIGHFMEKKVIAEFVQNQEAIQLLEQIGVDYAQGYGIEKPRRLNELLV